MDTRALRVRHPRFGRVALGLAMAAAFGACTLNTEPEDEPEPDVNGVPAADAGPDVEVGAGLAFTMHGIGTDGDGDPLTFRWWFEEVPEDSEAASFDDETSASPTFTPDVAGDYTLGLAVHDGLQESAPDFAVVTAVDHRTTALIGPAGGSLGSALGGLTLTLPPGALSEEFLLGINPVLAVQGGVFGAEFRDRLIDDDEPVGYQLYVQTESPWPALTGLGATVSYRSEALTEGSSGDTLAVGVRELFLVAGGTVAPLEDLVTDADLDVGGGVELHGVLPAWGLVAPATSLEVQVLGFPETAEVGSTFEVTVVGAWQPGEAAEVEVHTTAVPPLAGVDPVVGNGAFRVGVTSGAFVADLTYRCDTEGTGLVGLDLTGLAVVGAPEEEGFDRARIQRGVRCLSGEEPGLAKGLHEFGVSLSDVEAVAIFEAPLASFDGEDTPAAAFFGREGVVVRGLRSGMVLLDGRRVGATNAYTRGSIVTRADPSAAMPGSAFGGLAVGGPLEAPGPDVPAAIFASGIDFANPTSAMGGELWRYDPAAGTFADEPTRMPSAYWDQSPAGGMVTDEIVAATNHGVDLIQWNDGADTWTFNLDGRLPTDRYGLPGRILVTSATAARAYGPLLVTTGSNLGEDGRLYLDDRGASPTDVGALGQSPAMIRCALPVCAVVLARDDALRIVVWDGEGTPSIVGDPVPVGVGPGAVALRRLAGGVTLAATFTGFDSNEITVTELDDDGSVRSNTTVDLAAQGCRSPRGGDWIDNPADPEDPFLVVACYFNDQYYVTARSDLS